MPSDQPPDDENTKSATMKGEFDAGQAGVVNTPLFDPEELDIYVNKVTYEAFIFHGKDVEYDLIERIEYHPDDYSVDIIRKDGTRQDLGVKVQWLVRPYFSEADEIAIVQTKDGESINGCKVPLVHKEIEK